MKLIGSKVARKTGNAQTRVSAIQDLLSTMPRRQADRPVGEYMYAAID